MFKHLDPLINLAVEQYLLPHTPLQNDRPVLREQETNYSAGLNELWFITVISLHHLFSLKTGSIVRAGWQWLHSEDSLDWEMPRHSCEYSDFSKFPQGRSWSYSVPGGLPGPVQDSSEVPGPIYTQFLA